MKKNSFLRLTLAAAMLFTVSMNADAQFGKLKGIADKAKSTSKKVENAENGKAANTVSKAAKATKAKAEEPQLDMPKVEKTTLGDLSALAELKASMEAEAEKPAKKATKKATKKDAE